MMCVPVTHAKKMKNKFFSNFPFRTVQVSVLIATLVQTANVHADGDRLQELERRILELESRLLAQQQSQPPVESTPTAQSTSAKSIPQVKVTNDGGYALFNPDNGNELRFSAMLQMDGRFFASGSNATGAALDDGFLLRRVRPTFSGKFAGVGFRIVPELSGNGTGANISLLDAFADVPVGDNAYLRVGKQKTAVSIDRLRVATALPLIERGLANELAPNRDLGVSWNSSLADGRVGVVLGLFNGAADGRDVSSRDDAGKEIQARIFAEPFRKQDNALKGLGFGVSGTYGSKKTSQGNTAVVSNTLARYRTAAQEEFFSYAAGVTPTGTHSRLFPQLTYFKDNFGLVAEYGISDQELTRNNIESSIRNTGYDITFSWVPTGEPITFRGVELAKGSSSNAVELAFRVSGLSIDERAFEGGANRLADPDSAAREAFNYGLGLNFHVNRNLKWSVDFNSTRFSGGASAGRDREEEQVVMTRLQLVY